VLADDPQRLSAGFRRELHRIGDREGPAAAKEAEEDGVREEPPLPNGAESRLTATRRNQPVNWRPVSSEL
jgi:hypothetical protein